MFNHKQKETISPDEGIVQRYDVLTGLAESYFAVGRYEDARKACDKAIALHPDKRKAYMILAEIGRHDVVHNEYIANRMNI